MVVPFALAWERLLDTAELGLFDSILDLESRRQTKDAVSFSLLIGISSALATAAIGLPLAFMLGRWRWPGHGLLKVMSTLPFIVPSIVAAVGFLELLKPDGLFHSLTGLDLIRESGLVSTLNSASGFEHGGWLLAILLAHAWFNIALFVRLVEPVISRLDEKVVEQVMLLPCGRTRRGRLRSLWLPLLWTHAASAMVLTFVFCATSFAIILHFGGFEYHTMERAMAELGGAAGICADTAERCYGASASEVVLALSSIQLLVILAALSLQSSLARRSEVAWPLASVPRISPPPRLLSTEGLLMWSLMAVIMTFLLAPLLSIISASLHVQGSFSTEAWSKAFSGYSLVGGSSLADHLGNSLLYSALCALIVIPFTLLLCEVCTISENKAKKNPKKHRKLLLWASFNENLAMAPLALSSVMIGMGILVGIIRLDSNLIHAWWIPLIGHCMVALPFAVRSMIQPMRNLEPIHEEVAATLGMGPFACWAKVRMRLLRGPLIVATSLVMAISLGEFGASWVVIRATEYATLPMFIDAAISRPFDYLARPMAMVASTILLLFCAILHASVERFRVPGQTGGL